MLDSGHIINRPRSPSHHLSQSFRPPSLAARQFQSLFVCYVCQLGLFILRPIGVWILEPIMGPASAPPRSSFWQEAC